MTWQRVTQRKKWLYYHFITFLKELRNCNRKLFLCPPQKYAKTQPTFQTAIFLIKCILWLIKLNIYMYKTKFTSQKQYLCCLLLSRNVKRNIQTRVYYIFLVLSLKRNGSQTFKCSSKECVKQFRSSFKIAKDNLATISFPTRKSTSQVRKNIQMKDLILPVF